MNRNGLMRIFNGWIILIAGVVSGLICSGTAVLLLTLEESKVSTSKALSYSIAGGIGFGLFTAFSLWLVRFAVMQIMKSANNND